MKNKEMYEAPLTKLKQVELESGFMEASVVDKDDNTDSQVTAGNQEIENNYDFTDNAWE